MNVWRLDDLDLVWINRPDGIWELVLFRGYTSEKSGTLEIVLMDLWN